MFRVGLAVAVTVVTCRRKSEASDRGIISRGGSVRVGRGCLSERGATFCVERRRDRRAKGCDSEKKGAAEGGGRGDMVNDIAGRSKSSERIYAVFCVCSPSARNR